ncbi:hypothetical protein D3C76_1816820 [compost metagenome]
MVFLEQQLCFTEGALEGFAFLIFNFSIAIRAGQLNEIHGDALLLGKMEPYYIDHNGKCGIRHAD